MYEYFYPYPERILHYSGFLSCFQLLYGRMATPHSWLRHLTATPLSWSVFSKQALIKRLRMTWVTPSRAPSCLVDLSQRYIFYNHNSYFSCPQCDNHTLIRSFPSNFSNLCSRIAFFVFAGPSQVRRAQSAHLHARFARQPLALHPVRAPVHVAAKWFRRGRRCGLERQRKVARRNGSGQMYPRGESETNSWLNEWEILTSMARNLVS